MRAKTSITLPRELLTRIDRVDRNRSALLELAAEAYLKQLARKDRDRRDAGIIERNADRLNREAACWNTRGGGGLSDLERGFDGLSRR